MHVRKKAKLNWISGIKWMDLFFNYSPVCFLQPASVRILVSQSDMKFFLTYLGELFGEGSPMDVRI